VALSLASSGQHKNGPIKGGLDSPLIEINSCGFTSSNLIGFQKKSKDLPEFGEKNETA
jgi:hypothetical protein